MFGALPMSGEIRGDPNMVKGFVHWQGVRAVYEAPLAFNRSQSVADVYTRYYAISRLARDSFVKTSPGGE